MTVRDSDWEAIPVSLHAIPYVIEVSKYFYSGLDVDTDLVKGYNEFGTQLVSNSIETSNEKQQA